jgi:predicted dehydrogenase
MAPARIAVIGAGLIGRKHLGILKDDPAFEVAGIADPAPVAEAYAREQGFTYFKDTEALLDKAKPDGVVIANPNVLDRSTALACIARKTPAIVEKPVADTLSDALAIVRAAQAAKVPMLTGHHRRHNPISRRHATSCAAAHSASLPLRPARGCIANRTTTTMSPGGARRVAGRS